MEKAVISLSGGLDSTTLMAHILNHVPSIELHICNFFYGSKQNKYEQVAITRLIQHYSKNYNLVLHKIDLQNIFQHVSSDLLLSGGEIPEGHYEAEVMKKTVVPGRNMLFISIMASIAESIGASDIYIGVHSGDHHIYPDCRPDFIEAARNAVLYSTEQKIMLRAPFLHKNKADLVAIGHQINVPYEYTRTCYKDQAIACGKCGSCVERLEAFELNGLTDPIEYEN